MILENKRCRGLQNANASVVSDGYQSKRQKCLYSEISTIFSSVAIQAIIVVVAVIATPQLIGASDPFQERKLIKNNTSSTLTINFFNNKKNGIQKNHFGPMPISLSPRWMMMRGTPFVSASAALSSDATKLTLIVPSQILSLT